MGQTRFKPGDKAVVNCPQGFLDYYSRKTGTKETIFTVPNGTVIEIVRLAVGEPSKHFGCLYFYEHPIRGLKPVWDFHLKPYEPHPCTCPLDTLMQHGCQCGGE